MPWFTVETSCLGPIYPSGHLTLGCDMPSLDSQPYRLTLPVKCCEGCEPTPSQAILLDSFKTSEWPCSSGQMIYLVH